MPSQKMYRYATVAKGTVQNAKRWSKSHVRIDSLDSTTFCFGTPDMLETAKIIRCVSWFESATTKEQCEICASPGIPHQPSQALLFLIEYFVSQLAVRNSTTKCMPRRVLQIETTFG
jgi:hypothetical protein